MAEWLAETLRNPTAALLLGLLGGVLVAVIVSLIANLLTLWVSETLRDRREARDRIREVDRGRLDATRHAMLTILQYRAALAAGIDEAEVSAHMAPALQRMLDDGNRISLPYLDRVQPLTEWAKALQKFDGTRATTGPEQAQIAFDMAVVHGAITESLDRQEDRIASGQRPLRLEGSREELREALAAYGAFFQARTGFPAPHTTPMPQD